LLKTMQKQSYYIIVYRKIYILIVFTKSKQMKITKTITKYASGRRHVEIPKEFHKEFMVGDYVEIKKVKKDVHS